MAHSWRTLRTTFSESPLNKWRWNMVIKKKEQEKAEGHPLLEDTWKRPSQSTKFWALQNKLVYIASEYTTVFTECKQEKKKRMSNKAYDTTSDTIPWRHITVWSCIKKFGSHKGTKGSCHKYHSYWTGLFKFTPKVRSPRALGENKNTVLMQ